MPPATRISHSRTSGERRFEATSQISAPPHAVWDWHARPGAFERLVPPWQEARILDPGRGVAEGSRTLLSIRKNGVGIRWLAEHRNIDPPNGFDDVQIKGPFRRWEHRHRFDDARGGAVLRDAIRYLPPLGPLGDLFIAPSLQRDLERTFAYRHRTTAADLELHQRYATAPRLTVAISGASGLIGSALCAVLTTGGHRVIRLVRRPRARDDEAQWNLEDGVIDLEALDGIDAIVHLAGESIAGGRWTQRRMQAIRDSRVLGTAALLTSLERLQRPPATVISASAIGIYGDRGQESLDEASSQGTGFLADVGRAWENAARCGDFAARRVLTRFGIVLSPRGGALAKMLPAFRFGGGGRLGSGEQIMSWISIDDAVAAIVTALHDDRLSGAVNLTAPSPCSNDEFTNVLASTLGRPALVPVPAVAARALFGRMADEALLASANVMPGKLLATGFEFRHPDLRPALAHLLGRDLDGPAER